MFSVLVFIFHILFNLINITLFIQAFCPFYHNTLNVTHVEQSKEYIMNTKEFDRTILMVVDALRLDFLNHMPLTSNLIENHGCVMTVKVASPTVTLPRIKALTTGNIPQFVDVFYNLGTPGYVEDSILHRARKRKKKIVFYGDETWIKIFPDMFIRQEGTSSFFVTDFYEVDDNITRHLDSELQKDDWSMMILHYLGLDHIGHVHGPFSPLIYPKLQEMDSIFHKLFQETLTKKGRSLVLLTGDHGMKDSGGHGGSTYAETHVPLAILGVSCTNASIDQVDIAPNLAVLSNIEIPLTSIGKLNRNILKNLTLLEYLSALDYNSKILKFKHIECNDKFRSASELFALYLNKSETTVALKAVELYEECSKKLSDVLIKASVSQNIPSMIASVIFQIGLLFIFLNNSFITKRTSRNILIYIFFLFIRIFINEYIALLVVIIGVFLQFLRMKILRNLNSLENSRVVLLIIFLQPLTWLSSSFIEEEQEYWYFFLNSFILFQILKHMKYRNMLFVIHWVFISIIFRFAQTLNQTGDKWASLPDTSDWLIKPENFFINFLLLTISISGLYFLCCSKDIISYINLDKVILILIYMQKLEMFDNVYSVRILYILIVLNVILGRKYLHFWIFVICLLSKPYNMCLIPLCIYTCNQIKKDYGKGMVSTIAHLLLAKSFFFIQGNGNSLANVDVTVGYLGLKSYQPVLVGIQLLISVYSFTILVHLLIFESLLNRELIFKLLYTERSCAMIVACLISLFFKNHISVWTIYAPKLFIEFCHTVIIFSELIFYKLLLKEQIQIFAC